MGRKQAGATSKSSTTKTKSQDSEIGLKAATKDVIADYVREWVPRLGLNEFEIAIHFSEGEDTANAITQPEYCQHACNFNIPRIDWKLEHDPHFDLEEHVVHELAHSYTWKLWELSAKLLAGKDMQHAWEHVLKLYYEEATTRIGWALVETKRSLVDTS